jgi:hypothetical protein
LFELFLAFVEWVWRRFEILVPLIQEVLIPEQTNDVVTVRFR